MERKYIILTASDIQTLVNQVNVYLNQGWLTQGGVSFAADEKLYMQSIIKDDLYNEEDEDDITEEPYEPEDPSEPEPVEVRKIKIEDLDLSLIAFRELKGLRIHTVGEMITIDLDKIQNKTAKEEIKLAIDEWKKRL